jgi:hypothetical protein
VNETTPAVADFTTVPDNTPPEAPTITDAVESVTVFPYASTTRTTGIDTIASDNAGPDLVETTDDDTDDRPGEENVTDTGVETEPPYVRFVNVATPELATTPELACAPPNSATDADTAIDADTTADEAVTTLPPESCTCTTGCVTKLAPTAPATGSVASTNRDATPGPVGLTDPDTALVNEPDENVN